MSSEQVVVNPQPEVVVTPGLFSGPFGPRLAFLNVLLGHGDAKGTAALFAKCNFNVRVVKSEQKVKHILFEHGRNPMVERQPVAYSAALILRYRRTIMTNGTARIASQISRVGVYLASHRRIASSVSEAFR